MQLEDVVLIVLICLATFRVTWFITQDHFPPVAKLRASIVDSFGSQHWVSYLVRCVWCVSIYVGGAAALFFWLVSDLPYPVLVWLTASAVTGVIASVIMEDD